jgi:PAS domain S-box-containing protein
VGYATESPTFVLAATIVLGLLLPVPWVMFTFGYTGMERLVSLRVAGVVALPLVVGLVATLAVFGSQAVSGVDLPAAGTGYGFAAAAMIFLNLSQWFALLYAGGLMLVGSGLLVWTFHRYDHLDSTTGTMVGTFGTVPWLSILFGLQVNSISPLALGSTVAIGFLVGAGAAAALVGPSPLFERVPAAGNVGPRTVIEELADLVVVTDGEGRIVEVNRAAERGLGLDAGSALGTTLEEQLETSIPDLQEANTVELESDAGRRLFEPTVSKLTDQHDQPLGCAVVLRDVTERITRQQRLEVFNRVLRHNLRNDLTAIKGYAEMIRSRTDDDGVDRSAETILQTGRGLTTLSRKAREAEKILDTDETLHGEVRLASLVETVLADAAAGRKRMKYSHDVPDDIVVETTEKPLRLVLTNLVENAIEHNDGDRPEVRVSTGYTPDETYPLRIVIADDGPGIPAHEIRAIEAGSETPLQHGTGIGLWIVRWVTTNLGARLEFTEREPRGTRVTVHLPAAQRDSAAAEAAVGSGVE